jgi:hypothetical protein
LDGSQAGLHLQIKTDQEGVGRTAGWAASTAP